MASKIVIFALVVSICKVQSQSIGCFSNPKSSSSNGQSSCGCGPSLPQTIQIPCSNTNKGLKASPQLQIVNSPGQSCNLQAIPLSQLLAQASNQRAGTQQGCNLPRQGIQVTSIPQIPSSPAQCAQPAPCNPSVISAPVSTITIPPSGVTTIIDNSLSNSLANALQMMIANDFINSAVSSNIINQDCISIPVVETAVPGFDLSGFIKSLNANQLGQSCAGQSTGGKSKCSQPDDQPSSCKQQSIDWEQLLARLSGNQCETPQKSGNSDWSAILNYLNGQNDKSCETVKAEPESNAFNSFLNSLNQRGQTVSQIASQQPCQPAPSCDQPQSLPQFIPSSQNYDTDSGILEALAAYLGCSASEVSSNNYPTPNIADIVFPEEIPAQLICNYGYMPTSVPVVSFSVQPVGDSNCNFIVGSQC